MAEPWVDTEVLTAAQLAAMPWGVVGYVNGGTSDQTGITAVTDITSMSITFTAVSTRLYRISLYVVASKVTNNGNIATYVTDGAGTAQRQATATCIAGDAIPMVIVYAETGLSGSITRKARIAASSASCSVLGVQQQNSYFMIEDVGAA